MTLRPDSLILGRWLLTELYSTPGCVRYPNTERRLEFLLVGRLSGAGTSSLRRQDNYIDDPLIVYYFMNVRLCFQPWYSTLFHSRPPSHSDAYGSSRSGARWEAAGEAAEGEHLSLPQLSHPPYWLLQERTWCNKSLTCDFGTCSRHSVACSRQITHVPSGYKLESKIRYFFLDLRLYACSSYLHCALPTAFFASHT